MDNEKKEENHIAKLGGWLALLAASSAASSAIKEDRQAVREEQHDWREFTFSDGHTEMVPWDLVEKRLQKIEKDLDNKEKLRTLLIGLAIMLPSALIFFFLIAMLPYIFGN